MFPSSINLNELNGKNGFVINGIDGFGVFGGSVSNIGDINGDGFDDIIIGAPGAKDGRGEGYVVFGGSNVGSNGSFDINKLNGTNGFILTGLNSEDLLGTSVTDGGDINGDNFDDFIIGGVENYVVFGDSDVGSNGSFDLASLNAQNGFAIEIAVYSDGSVTNAGDIDGDGFDDILIGAPNPAPLVGLPGFIRNGNDPRGKAFILFGDDSNIGRFGRLRLETINNYGQINGLIIDSDVNDDAAGSSVSKAGDVNGDGLDDIIIGAKNAGFLTDEPDSLFSTDLRGESYIIFGGSNLRTQGTLEIADLNGENGFVIKGVAPGDNSGSLVSNAGDVNGDAFDDIIVVAPFADNSAEAYVVFGGSNITNSGSLELSNIDGTNGFEIAGVDFLPFSKSISSAGDINRDGIDDLIISEPNSSESYLLLGKTNLGSGGSIDISNPKGDDIIVLQGVNNTRLGTSVSNAGDINGDGIDDIVVASPDTGESYVVFGMKESFANKIIGTPENDTIDGTVNADKIHALAGDDSVRGLAGDDTINGDAGQDTLFGNNGNDVIDGGDGNDTLWGQADHDSVNGGKGRDRILGNNGNDTLSGGNGVDTLFGGNGNDLVFGNIGNDQVIGNAGDDSLFGGADNDILFGYSGADELFGEAGNDVLWGQANNDFLAGGIGTDILYGNNGNDILVGGDGTDSLFGNAGKDFLAGNTGNDILFGNGGNDTLWGGQGNDTLWSGNGNDVLELTRGANVGVDRVKDYQDRVDKFLLSDRFGLGSLEFSDLTITQNGNNAEITITQNNQLLAIVENTNAAQLDSDDFVTV